MLTDTGQREANIRTLHARSLYFLLFVPRLPVSAAHFPQPMFTSSHSYQLRLYTRRRISSTTIRSKESDSKVSTYKTILPLILENVV